MHVYDPEGERLCEKYGNCRDLFHQPGAKTGKRNALNREERRSCAVVEELMMGDIPGVKKTTFTKKCPKGFSKAAGVVDRGTDYHWYRQDRDGMWSHKDGSNKVKRYDALKRPIVNPELASRNYRWQGSNLNYEDFCGFYCVPRDKPIVLGRGANAPKSRRARRGRNATRKGRKATRKTRKVQRAGGVDVRLDMIPPLPAGTIFPVPSPSSAPPFAPLYGLAPPHGFGFPGDIRQAILGSTTTQAQAAPPPPYTPGVPGIGGTPIPGAAPGLLTGSPLA